MKLANIALLGAASAHSNFLQESILELDAAKTAPAFSTRNAWTKYDTGSKVGEALCQPHEGVIFWDLKQLDQSHDVDYIGTGEKGFGGSTFGVEMCEQSFDATKMPAIKLADDKSLTVGTPTATGKGNAYWNLVSEDGKKFIPTYSFLSGHFESTQDKETEAYNGWTLNYVSQENCGTADEPPKPFVMTINGVCDSTSTAAVWSDYKLDGDCGASVEYTGKHGCVAFNGHAVVDAIKPFSGVLLILIGGLMTFAGAKFLFQLVSAVVTLVTTILFYLVISNLFFTVRTGAGFKISLLIASILLGIGAAFLSYKLTIRYAIPIVAGAGGGFGFKLISNLAGLRNEYAAIGILVLGICVGVYAGFKLNEFVRTIGTAFLGSYILIRGAGFFFGGFPEGADDVKTHGLKATDKIVWYFVGFVVFFIAGSVVQYKLFHNDEDLKNQHDEMFEQNKGEDDEKTCGCF